MPICRFAPVVSGGVNRDCRGLAWDGFDVANLGGRFCGLPCSVEKPLSVTGRFFAFKSVLGRRIEGLPNSRKIPLSVTWRFSTLPRNYIKPWIYILFIGNESLG